MGLRDTFVLVCQILLLLLKPSLKRSDSFFCICTLHGHFNSAFRGEEEASEPHQVRFVLGRSVSNCRRVDIIVDPSLLPSPLPACVKLPVQQ